MSSLYDSLTIGGVIELAGQPGGVPSVNPMCPGAVFGLDPSRWDLGDPQPTTDYTASLVYDGSRPFGNRADDRTSEIDVIIKAPDFLTLAGAVELLYSTIDAQQWPMVWTPRMTQAQIDAGQVPLPTVYDCFRAQPSKMAWGGVTGFNNEPVGKVTIKFEALPYGRSDTKTQLAFASPIASLNAPPPPPAPVVLDGFTSINSTQFTQTQVCRVGPFAGFWDPLFPPFARPDGAGCPLSYSNTFAAPVNLTGMTSLKMWVGLGSRYYFNHHPRGRTQITLTYTLTDAAGQVMSWTTLTDFLPVSQNPASPALSLVSVRIPAPPPGFDITRVAGYSLVMVNKAPTQLLPSGEFRWTCVTLDALTAYPSTTVSAAPSSRGTVYDVHGVPGTHYAPISVTAQSPPTAGSATVITAAGPGSYTVPANTLYVGGFGFGGGGPGGTMTAAGQGDGGGGAESAGEPQFPGSSTGVVIPYQVGAGGGPGTAGQDTTMGPVPGQSLVLTCHGGRPAGSNGAGPGAGGDGSVNTQHYPGAAGRAQAGGLAGGGGSSAGSAAPGNSPVGTSSQTFATSGSVTIPAGAGPVTITLTGASGGAGGGPYGAAGGGGEVLPFTLNLAAGTYPFTIGAAGAAGSSGSNGGPGGDTFMTIAGTTYTAHGGHGGKAFDYFNTGGGQGGRGSAGGQPGGDGGGGYPYGGGGGSSAGPGQPGNDGDSYANPGIAPTGGGSGGRGSGNASANGHQGQAPGGGGGGAARSGFSGAAGQPGQAVFAYSAAGAPTSNGGVAPAGGGNGGAGGAAASNGSAGSQPGGGGGGGNSTGTARQGGFGGDGKLTITPFGFAQFPTLLLHRPGIGAPAQFSPIVPIGNVAPGSTEFPVPPVTARTTSWGFEDGTTSSFTGIGAALTNSTAWANSGTHSLLATADGTNPGGQWGASSPSQPAQPGDFVTVTAVVKNPGGSSLTAVKLSVTWLGSGGGALSTSSGGTSSVGAGATASLSLSGVQAPAGTQAFTVNVADAASVSAGVALAADDITYTLAPPARFDGTYTFLAAFGSFDNPTAPRTCTVTVNQYEAAGGTKWTAVTDPVTFTPATQVKNGIVNLGNLTLPPLALAKDNAMACFTVQITDSDTSDTVLDLLIIDNNGQTVLVNEDGAGYTEYFFDEPDPKYDLGLHLGSQNGRPQAISVAAAIDVISGGPLTLEPGDNKLLAWSLSGTPQLGIEFFSRWYQQRLE